MFHSWRCLCRQRTAKDATCRQAECQARMVRMAHTRAECPVRDDCHGFSPICLTAEEMDAWDEILDLLCEGAPRRISCEMAVWSTMPIAMSSCFIVNSPALSDGMTEIEGETVWHYRESEDTLFAGSLFVSESTCVSSPERALLDCTGHSGYYKTAKLVLQSLAARPLDPVAMIDTAEKIGGHDPLRRICSIASLLKPSESPRDWLLTIEEHVASLPMPPIYLCGETEPTGPRVFW